MTEGSFFALHDITGQLITIQYKKVEYFSKKVEYFSKKVEYFSKKVEYFVL